MAGYPSKSEDAKMECPKCKKEMKSVDKKPFAHTSWYEVTYQCPFCGLEIKKDENLGRPSGYNFASFSQPDG